MMAPATHILSVLVWLPLAGAAVLFVVPRTHERFTRAVAIGWALLTLTASLALARYDTTLGGYQFVEDVSWIPTLGARYSLGVDGISVAFVLCTTLLFAAAITFAARGAWNDARRLCAALLVLETTILGALVAMDLLLFVVFFEASLVPAWFLVARRDDSEQTDATRFVVTALASTSLLLLGALAIGATTMDRTVIFDSANASVMAQTIAAENPVVQSMVEANLESVATGRGTFNIPTIQALFGSRTIDEAPLVPIPVQGWIFVALILGFALRVAIVPLHGWAAVLLTRSPGPAAAVVAGSVLPLGVYGVLRIVLPVLPDVVRSGWVWAPIVAVLASGGLFAALCAIHHAATATGARRALGLATSAQMALALAGLFSLTPSGITGGAVLVVAHGLAFGVLFLAVPRPDESAANPEDRPRTDTSGPRTRVLEGVALVAAVSAAGLPLLVGFVGLVLVVRGNFEANVWLGAVCLADAVLVSVATAAVARTIFAQVVRPNGVAAPRAALLADAAAAGPIAVLLVVLGVYPAPILGLLQRPVQLIAHQIWRTDPFGNRYAPTPEEQERYTREWLERTRDAAPSEDPLAIPEVESPGGEPAPPSGGEGESP